MKMNETWVIIWRPGTYFSMYLSKVMPIDSNSWLGEFSHYQRDALRFLSKEAAEYALERIPFKGKEIAIEVA